ncbi:uncharacterized protein LOC121375821 [Gigantopelta aegis]|uniref:uncharacterized protein LOC121375821 n=1 Tax=Gigantopelta aegis TaxID=1735272 RepID=UPI001B889A9A|nr:uncharacterized protein LOC121375821 [Gigantopelta aegis]
MTQRQLHAMDYADWHAQNILAKHAKKRPLGLIENKYNITLAQPLLTWNGVDIDITGSRTFRPKSTAEIIKEQHKSIHKLFEKSRNISSAPTKRVTSAKRHPHHNNINIEVKGKPISSAFRPFQATTKPVHPSTRPKTTGNLQRSKSSFMVVKVDPDLIKTSGFDRDLTQQIHNQFQTKNHDLSKGMFVRGKKRPETVPTKTEAWLTFGGAQSDASTGVVDAFASWRNSDQYYAIDGSVGSKVAQHLERGDKIRIGINGVVQSHDLKINTDWKEEQEKENEFPAEDDLDFYFRELSTLMDEKKTSLEAMAPLGSLAPLSWDDQIKMAEAKIMTPRLAPDGSLKPRSTDCQPVIFEKLTGVTAPGHRTWATRTGGYQVKHRLKSQHPRPPADLKEPRANRIKVVSIDHRSVEEEDVVNSLSVDEVLRLTVEKYHAENGKETGSRNDVGKEKKRGGVGGVTDVNNSSTLTHHAGGSEALSGQAGDHSDKSVRASIRHPSSDLSIVTPGARNKPAFSETSSSYKRTSAKPPKGHRVGFLGVGTTLRHETLGETEYIQISSRIGNIKQAPAPSHQQQHTAGGEAGSLERVTGLVLDDVLMHTPLAPQTSCVTKVDDVSFMPDDMAGGPPSPVSSYMKSPSTSFQISIPTGDDASDGDSQLHTSPMRKMSPTEDDGQDAMTGQGKREMDVQKKQIDDITTLLAGSLINGDGVHADEIEHKDDDTER